MMTKLLSKVPKARHLLFLLFIFTSFNSFADVICGSIEGFEFSNGHETVNLMDGESYIINDLPDNFYVNLNVDGYSQSVRYEVENLDTGEVFKITETSKPYTFPAGNGKWNLGNGTFRLKATLYKFNLGFGRCDTKTITFSISDSCVADAGTLMSDMDMVTLVNGTATISATVKDAANVPAGYANAYVLTKGEGLVIQALGGEPSFEVTEAGMYTIHSIVFNPETLDTNIVVPGETTGFDVFGLIIPGGGSICASLDVAGAPVTVEEENCVAYSGTLYSTGAINCLVNGSTVLTAQENEAALIPKGYEQLFVLTNAFSLTILDVSNTPSFEVKNRGFYRIHSLVYNPATLDLSIVVPGQTTGFDVVNLINENGICASLDVKGAVNLVIGSRWFCFFFNKYFNKSAGVKDIAGKGTNNTSDLDDLVNKFNSYEAFKNDFIASNGDTKFYPNPVINTLNAEIELLDDETMNYSVIDIQGRRVMSGPANNLGYGSQVIDASRLNTGMYLVQFVSEYRTITKKIVVRK
jgi:hypothetical protein